MSPNLIKGQDGSSCPVLPELLGPSDSARLATLCGPHLFRHQCSSLLDD